MAEPFEEDEIKAWHALLALRHVFDAEPTTPEEVTAALEREFLKPLPTESSAFLVFLEDECHYAHIGKLGSINSHFLRDNFKRFNKIIGFSGILYGGSLRERLPHIPILNQNHHPAKELRLRDCQEIAIANLEVSCKLDRTNVLIQMATGAGKTYTVISSIYRAHKHAHGKRILFLLDTRNLGEQAE